jgi:hypothetical protein
MGQIKWGGICSGVIQLLTVGMHALSTGTSITLFNGDTYAVLIFDVLVVPRSGFRVES